MTELRSQTEEKQPIEGEFTNKALPFAVEKGWTAVPNAIYTVYMKHPDMNTTAVTVYGYLLRLYNAKYGYAYPTITEAAISLGVSPGTIQTAISKLRKVGLINVKYSVRHNNNTYTFPEVCETIEELEAKFPEIGDHLRRLEENAVKYREIAEADKLRLRELRAK